MADIHISIHPSLRITMAEYLGEDTDLNALAAQVTEHLGDKIVAPAYFLGNLVIVIPSRFEGYESERIKALVAEVDTQLELTDSLVDEDAVGAATEVTSFIVPGAELLPASGTARYHLFVDNRLYAEVAPSPVWTCIYQAVVREYGTDRVRYRFVQEAS